jgi:uncharacterized protein YpuA (DUF1002 family)
MTQYNLNLIPLPIERHTYDIDITPIKPKLRSHIKKDTREKWLNTYIDHDYQYIDVIEDINKIISDFMNKYNITTSEHLNQDLIDFLYEHSNNGKYI